MMILAAIPPVGPAVTLGELFGPLAPIAVLAVLAGLVIVTALVTSESWIATRRRARATVAAGQVRKTLPMWPAAFGVQRH